MHEDCFCIKGLKFIITNKLSTSDCLSLSLDTNIFSLDIPLEPKSLNCFGNSSLSVKLSFLLFHPNAKNWQNLGLHLLPFSLKKADPEYLLEEAGSWK